MLPDQRDAAYLWDMLEAARSVLDMTRNLEYEGYLSNRMVQLAVEREVEIIGEAARHLSESLRSAHPEIPWRRIIAQRHVLAHEYGDIRQDRLWRVATIHLPELIEQLVPLVPPPPQGVSGQESG